MFEGTFTALVTPFTAAGAVDYRKLQDLVEMQIAAGIDGLVPVGTTGESPTLDNDEHKKVIETVVKAVHGRVKVVAGTGANATAEAIELTRFAAGIGADGTLQVTPYYNKPSQTGLIRHFSAVADLGLPVVLYNVPARTSREIDVATVAELAKHPKIVAVKEAGGSVERVSRIRAVCGITVLCGDDSLTLPMMVCGAAGVVSVASNIAPRQVAEMVRAARGNDWLKARAMHDRLFSLFTDLFLDTNPVPVKAAMAMAGLIEETYRLPLCEMAPGPRAKLRNTLAALGLVKA
jgi:4-hydroxy-tetrahydrodipicolinate synthase